MTGGADLIGPDTTNRFAWLNVDARPVERPTFAFRIFIGIVSIGLVLFNVALLLSDRAPDFTREAFGGFARRLSDRLDAQRRAELVRDGGLPESDAIVHIGLWAVATFLVVLTVWTWRSALLIAPAVFGVSLIIELAQGRYSTTRDIERSDMFANAVGVICGLAAALACMAAWMWVTRAVRGIQQRQR